MTDEIHHHHFFHLTDEVKDFLKMISGKSNVAASVADLNTTGVTTPAPNTKETKVVDFGAIENRFWKDLGEVTSDAEAALHTKVVDAVVSAAKDILPLVPDGADIENLLSKLDEVAAEAHNLVAEHTSSTAEVAAEAVKAAPAPVDAAAALDAPVEAASPVEEAVAASPTDSGEAATEAVPPTA